MSERPPQDDLAKELCDWLLDVDDSLWYARITAALAQRYREGAKAMREATLAVFDNPPVEHWPTGWREKYPALALPSKEEVRNRIRHLSLPGDPQMTDALAPCPFCGGKADWDSSDTSNHQWIFCTACSAEMRGADPFMAWNRRPSSPGDAERLATQVADNITCGYDMGDGSISTTRGSLREAIYQHLSAALRLTPQPAGPAPGWRCVPEEPTEAMLDAMHRTSRIEAIPAKREANILNDRAIWQAMLAAGPAPPAVWRPEEIDVVNTLIDLVYRVDTALDDSEDVGGANYLVPADSASDVIESINKLSELPDDKPGAVMGPAAKVRWALRRILPPAPPAPKEGV